MKRVIRVFCTVAFLSAGLAEITAEPTLKLHFAGIETLTKREDAKTLKAIWSQKETRELRTEVLGKLANHLGKISGGNSSQFKYILSDLGLGETILKVTTGDNGQNISLMATMSNTRGKEWIKQLKQLAKSTGATLQEQQQAGTTGWRVDFKEGRSLGFGYVNGWMLVGIGQSTFKPLKQAARKIYKEGRAIPADTENDLTIEVQASALPAAIKNQLPSSANSIRITSKLKKDNFFTKAVVEFNKELPNKIENWEIPTRTITEPLVSFTAARGIGLSTAQEVLKPLQLKPTNNQFFAWSQGRTKFQSFFAVKVDDPKTEIASLAKRISDFKKTGNDGESYIGNVVHDPKKPSVTWGNVPLFAPYLTKGNSDDKGYVVGGVFPPDPIKKPIPKELLSEFINKENLIYYNWEITGQRLAKWNLLIQFAAILSDEREQLVNKTKGISFITSLYSKLGNTITDATLSSNKLTITRKSHLGLSALEIALATRWLDNPQFPKLTLEWPNPTETSKGKSKRTKKKPAAKK
jgi:hypothetical protein